MKVRELIKELQDWDPEHIVHVSIDCDVTEKHDGRRVFGYECMGINAHFDEAILMFLLESANFEDAVEKPDPRIKVLTEGWAKTLDELTRVRQMLEIVNNSMQPAGQVVGHAKKHEIKARDTLFKTCTRVTL